MLQYRPSAARELHPDWGIVLVQAMLKIPRRELVEVSVAYEKAHPVRGPEPSPRTLP